MNSTKFLSPIELDTLEASLMKNITSDQRNVLLLLVAKRTGARATEVLNITKSDLMPGHHSIIIHGIKGSQDREIPIDKSLFKTLYKYAMTVEGDRLFPISYERMVQIWQLYRTARKPLKSLRHSFALNLYNLSKDIRLVQKALGHRALSSTEHYQTYSYTQTEFKKYLCKN